MHAVPDYGMIGGIILAGGLVGANVACFGTNACDSSGKAAVGMADGAVVVTGVALLVVVMLGTSALRD